MTEKQLRSTRRLKTDEPKIDDKHWWYHEYLFDDEKCRSMLRNYNPETVSNFRKLHKLLMDIGGYEACFPITEDDMRAILTRAYYRKGSSVLRLGEPGQCHVNTANAYEQNSDTKDLIICTGYALSKDGIWRQHSWLLEGYNTSKQYRYHLIETTEKRVAYFGFELSPEEAEAFCDKNW